MKRGRLLFRWPGSLLVCAAISIICIKAYGKKEPLITPESGRPDLVTIDTLAAFGKLELPPVTFFHDKHTEALLKEKKDCKTCHLVEDDKLSLTFKRSKATRPAEIKQIYHSNCIGCHMEMAAAGKKSGPPDGMCRSCHNAEPKIVAARLDLDMNNKVFGLWVPPDTHRVGLVNFEYSSPNDVKFIGDIEGNHVVASTQRVDLHDPEKFLLMNRGMHWVTDFPHNR